MVSNKQKIMKHNKDFFFIRFGNLNPIKHKEASNDGDDRGYHTAPVKYGVYAFPKGYVETFLIGGWYTTDRAKYLLDENGEKVRYEDFWAWDNKKCETFVAKKYIPLLKKMNIKQIQLCAKDEYKYVGVLDKPKHFKYDGEIWCHLSKYVNRNDIIKEKGSWIKVSFDTYMKALKKADTKERFDSYIILNKMGDSYVSGNPHRCRNIFAKDYYEVFIEKIP